MAGDSGDEDFAFLPQEMVVNLDEDGGFYLTRWW